MAKTLIGELIFRMSHNATAKAKEVEAALKGIETAGRRLERSPWGVAMQRQLDALKVSPAQQRAVQLSWERLYAGINAAGLQGRDKKAAFAEWRTATLAHFADVRAGMQETEDRARRFASNMRNIMRPVLAAIGAYTVWTLGGQAIRGGAEAGSEREREYFRQDMAGIPANEQLAIAARSAELSNRYRSVSQTQIMEMARTARNTMGSTEGGLSILEEMVRGYVTLQSAKGTDAASSELTRLIRGLDNLGVNAGGELGAQQMKEVIAGAVRAAQIEGAELDIGKYFDFARRSKIAGPGLSTQFLATTVPAFMQDMTAEGFGTALSSAYQSLVIGSSAVASKANLQNQKRLGLREGGGGPQGFGALVGADLFATDPYQWVKQHLVPALTKDGVDISDDAAVAQAVAQLSRNTLATGLLTRMITQMPQIDRLVGMYGKSMGTDAADRAAAEDPFVAWKGFLTSFENLAGAMSEQMTVITPALITMTDLINNLAGAVKENPFLAMGGMAAGGAGLVALGGALFSLVTAGPQLQVAAAMLQQAAVMQGATKAGGAAVAGGAAAAGGFVGWLLKALKIGGAAGAVAAVMQPTAVNASEDDRLYADPAYAAMIDKYEIHPEAWAQGPVHPRGAVGARRRRARERAKDDIPGGMAGYFMEGAKSPRMIEEELDAAVEAAGTAGAKIEEALSVTAKPVVDTSSVQSAIGLYDTLLARIRQVNAMAGKPITVGRPIDSSYSDYGVTP